MDDNVTPADSVPALLDAARSGGLLPAPLELMKDIAQQLAVSKVNIPAAFHDNPDRCLAIVYQSARWGLDPWTVASKAYVTKGKDGAERISYEAQLINAVINTRAPLEGRLTLEYKGDGGQRYLVVSGRLKGSAKASPLATPRIANIKPKNSPLWYSDPDQQLAYYGQRAWARRYCPEVILGVYTHDEMQHIEIIESTPQSRMAAYDDDAQEEIDGEPVSEEELAAMDLDPEVEPSGGDDYKAPSGDREASPSGGHSHANSDGQAKEQKRDLGPNPWPDFDDIMEWLAAFTAEIEEQADHALLIKRWDQARAHGMVARLKRADERAAKDLADLMTRRARELTPKEEKGQ